MKQINSLAKLEDLGRVQLSKNFYMRDFLYSEIANFHGIPNMPEFPDVAIEAGKQLCEQLLEPLQDSFGRLAIRSAYRSKEINGFGNQMQREGKVGYNCASNEANYGGHIWDVKDSDGFLGARLSLVVPSFAKLFNDEAVSWTQLAWWIHDNLPYSEMFFFPKNAAFNLTWSENPKQRIDSYIAPKGILTKAGMGNNTRDHSALYPNVIKLLAG